jgi:hydrogenase maturation protein HypF
LNKSTQLLNGEKIIAVKGIGGYHLVCDATNDQAVKHLREIKIRDSKPFAVMFKDISSMKPYVVMTKKEKECLVSWRRPIVLLSLNPHSAPLRGISPCINPGMKTLGCMLPYMPIHYDWFEKLKTPVLVMTSGNLNDRPIIITPEEAESELGGKVDLIIHHNRPIYNRVDDSVVQICGEQVSLIRRSRAYVPEPVFADISTEGILAFGAEKVNTFALGKGNTIIQSQYIGDLKNEEIFGFYTESMERFRHLFRFTPTCLVCDRHPDYFSSLHAEKMASEYKIPLLRVQHHHAHAVACMLEYGLHEPVIAVVWDGTGLGDDGAAWGGEFFLCDRKQYKRLSHPEYVPMPGGDNAALEPWRMAFAYLHHYQLPVPGSFAKRIGLGKIKQIEMMIEKKINSPLTSSIGRLFDGFASLIGICDKINRQAEAAILLEQQADKNCRLFYPMNTGKNPVSFELLFKGVLEDFKKNIPVAIMAAKFHNTLANLIVSEVKKFTDEYGKNKVVVSGGCFQNKFLSEKIHKLFSDTGISLYFPAQIPCNDSGIAAGQLVIASEYA